MKKIAVLCFVMISMPFLILSQTITSIEFISPFNDGLAAIKKGNQWAFIDSNGAIVIDFRGDVETTNIDGFNYPIFKNDRCLISETREGITYFGFIDKSGMAVIKPQFLNATNFNNNTAIALYLIKDTIGNNNILKKPIVRYGYLEVVLKLDGEIIYYLTLQPKLFTLSKKITEKPPEITTKLLSNNLMAIKSQDNKWEIKKVE